MTLPVFTTTNEALAYASHGLTVEQRLALTDRRQMNIEAAREAQDKGNPDAAFRYATLAQFDREALQYEREVQDL